MTGPTCKDCPAVGEYVAKNDLGEFHNCRLLPQRVMVMPTDWCYMGRLIMAADTQDGLMYELRKLFDPYGRGKVVEGGPF